MTTADDPMYVTISLDIDPDANSAVEGRHDALSSPVKEEAIRVDACKMGLLKILELLDAHDVAATLFYEARTAQMLEADGMDLPALSERHEVACHSLKHEDFLGKVSGMPMEEDAIEKTASEAVEILKNMFGRTVKGFRAPYTRINHAVVRVLERMGFMYDSSETMPLGNGWTGNPFPLKTFGSKLMELALPSFPDANGKMMSSYLWAIFEGRRGYQEYTDAVLRAQEVARNGLFVFSIHPWHLYVNSRGVPFSTEQARQNVENLERIFSSLKRMDGIEIVRQDEYMEWWLNRSNGAMTKTIVG